MKGASARMMLTAFGLGLLRPAPGTWGSLLAPGVALGLVWGLGAGGLSGVDRWIINITLIALLIIFSAACIVWGLTAESFWGRKDPSQVVADEVAGQSIALLALPWKAMVDGPSVRMNLTLALVAFATFRVFDITKPPPINGLQRLPAGWGILVDDLIAGVYALIVTQLVVIYILPQLWG